MSRDQFISVLGKKQIANLRTSLNRFCILQLDCVPEFDCSVLGTATCSEQTLLMRGPGDRLDCSLMLVELSEWL